VALVDGDGAVEVELPLEQPATAASAAPTIAIGATFTPPRYVTRSDTICS